MALSLTSLLEAVAARLRSPGFRRLLPLLVLALARFIYYRRRRHLDQLRVHRQIQDVLADGHEEDHALDHRAVEEWHDVGDGVSFGSIVYLPKPSTPKSNILVVVIPGNPGFPHFYLPLMRDILRRFGTHHEVRALSHAGHYMPWKNNGHVFDLKDHHEHKIAYLKQRLTEDPTLRLVLVSHSIGGYLMVKIMEALPSHAVAKAVFMQPTFHHIGKSDKGKGMMPLFKHRKHSVKLIKLVAYIVPLRVRRWLAHHAVGGVKEAAFVDTAVALVNHKVMTNVLHMAHQEMLHVGDVDEHTVRTHEHKTLFVYSPYDGWLPNEFVQMLQLKFPRAKHRVIPQGHGFMVEPNGSKDMADHIAQSIADAFESPQPATE